MSAPMNGKSNGSAREAGPALTALELSFLLSYMGIDPPAAGPRTQVDAYIALFPTTDRQLAYDRAHRLMNACKRKGALAWILEMADLGLSRCITYLRESANSTKLIPFRTASGSIDFAEVPDNTNRLRARVIALKIHGLLKDDAAAQSSHQNMTWTDRMLERAAAQNGAQYEITQGKNDGQEESGSKDRSTDSEQPES